MSRFRQATGRLRTWCRAFLAPAPDPRQTVAETLARQRALLRRVRESREELSAAGHRLESRLVSMLGLLTRLEDRARDQLRSGREDAARAMLARRWVVARETRTLEERARELRREGEQLGVVEERLATRIAAFDAREQVLAARTSASDAQARIAEALAGLSAELGDLGPVLDEAERRAEESQARAWAIEQLVEDGSLEPVGPAGGGLLQGMAELDRARAVDEQIDRLRREVDRGAMP